MKYQPVSKLPWEFSPMSLEAQGLTCFTVWHARALLKATDLEEIERQARSNARPAQLGEYPHLDAELAATALVMKMWETDDLEVKYIVLSNITDLCKNVSYSNEARKAVVPMGMRSILHEAFCQNDPTIRHNFIAKAMEIPPTVGLPRKSYQQYPPILIETGLSLKDMNLRNCMAIADYMLVRESKKLLPETVELLRQFCGSHSIPRKDIKPNSIDMRHPENWDIYSPHFS